MVTINTKYTILIVIIETISIANVTIETITVDTVTIVTISIAIVTIVTMTAEFTIEDGSNIYFFSLLELA